MYQNCFVSTDLLTLQQNLINSQTFPSGMADMCQFALSSKYTKIQVASYLEALIIPATCNEALKFNSKLDN